MVGRTGGRFLLYRVGTEAALRRHPELCLHVSVVGELSQHFLYEWHSASQHESFVTS